MSSTNKVLLAFSFLFLSASANALNLQKISADSTNDLERESPISIVNQPSAASYELTCRAKAKEIAAETYRSCVTENRNAEIEKLRKDYQERLRSLKQDYEKEIDHLNEKNDRASEKTNKTKAQKKGEPKFEMRTKNQSTIEARASLRDLSSHIPVNEIARNQIGPAVLTDDSVMDIPEPIPVETFKR